MVHTLPYFLQALTRIGLIAAIIPKSLQYVLTVLKSLKEIYELIICDNSINKIALKKEPVIVRLFFNGICDQYPEHKLIILDHSGYFAPCLDIIQRHFSEQIPGIVEHTCINYVSILSKIDNFVITSI